MKQRQARDGAGAEPRLLCWPGTHLSAHPGSWVGIVWALQGAGNSKNLQASSLCRLTSNFFRYTNKKSHSPNKLKLHLQQAWLHVADNLSSAFRKTSNTRGNAWVGFDFVRNHPQSVAMDRWWGKAFHFPSIRPKSYPGQLLSDSC